MNIYKIDNPAHILEDIFEISEHIKAVMDNFMSEIAQTLKDFIDTPDPQNMLYMETVIQKLMSLAGSHMVGGVLSFLHCNPQWKSKIIREAKNQSSLPLKHKGQKTTVVRFLGGALLRFSTPYLAVDHSGKRGRKRNPGRRGNGGNGCYPLLEALGIHIKATPALVSEVAKQSVRCSSFEEASDALHERGIQMDAKSVRTLALHLGNNALEQRTKRIEAAQTGTCFSDEFCGKRVLISTDGGRIRTREESKRGRKQKNGHRRYQTPWCEPKLIAVEVIDENGKRLNSSLPLYDGTLGDADATFRLLSAELKLRGAGKAKEIIIVGDGAKWIWNRVDDLIEFLDFDSKKVVRVADFYHAVEHLGEIAALKPNWSSSEKENWLKRMRKKLLKGRVNDVIQAAKKLCRGRNSKKIAAAVRYFANRQKEMQYAKFRQCGIPLGSGMMESAVRRVINLRLKGPAMFWNKPCAEAMLHLRSYLKAGRWNEILQRVICKSLDVRSTKAQQEVA